MKPKPPSRSALSILFGAAVILVTGVALAISDSTGADAAVPTNRVMWDGKARFLAGANVPWYNWACDFGCGTSGGVREPAVRAALDERFGRLAATDMQVLRWWMFEPSSPGVIRQIRPGANGQLEVDPAVYGDIDAALTLAEKHDLYFTFVLFSGVGPDQLPAAWLNNLSQRQQLANALAPLFARYANNPRVMAWDIFNEPEWQIWGGQASEANAVSLASLIAAQVHANSPTLVTLGEAILDGIPMWKSVPLDFHSPHWYSNIESGDWCAICRDYASISRQWGVTIPVVIGEWDAKPDAPQTRSRWQHWLDAGYAGAWGWSIFPERTNDRIAFDYNAATNFMVANAGVLQGSTPTATPKVTTTATASATATPKVTTTATASATATPKVTTTATASATATPKVTTTATATASATATPKVTTTPTATSTATASPTPTAVPTPTGPECQALFRFRDKAGAGTFREIWRLVNCKTGDVLEPVR